MLKIYNLDSKIRCSSFSTPRGSDEFFITVLSEDNSGFNEAAAVLKKKYSETLSRFGLSDKTQVFSRLYLSDIENQKKLLEKTDLIYLLADSALSIVQEQPVDGGPISLFSYHIKPNNRLLEKKLFNSTKFKWCNGLTLEGNHYKMLWTANYSSNEVFNSEKQTKTILESLNADIERNGITFRNDTLRTWIYVRDIDNHYHGMVKARREFFTTIGLTDKTRYLASTGIEGKFNERNSLVSIDSLSIGGLQNGQIVRMEARDHLSPTIKYGVTFERGLKVMFGDRSHFYISGTASIDKNGELIYEGNVKKQTEHTLKNIRALLEAQGAGFQDMAYILVYLRDQKAKYAVRKIIENLVPDNIPYLMVEGAVCRPGWLVEIEGVGIKINKNNFAPFL